MFVALTPGAIPVPFAAMRGISIIPGLLAVVGCTSGATSADAGRADVVVTDVTDVPDVVGDIAVDLPSPKDLPGVVDAPPPDRVVESCAEIVVAGAASRAGSPVAGWPLLYGVARGGDLVVRAPAVARPTVLTIGSLRVEVRPQPAPTFDIAGLAADCGPFAEGIASGDPTSSSVTLWTRVAAAPGAPVTLRWSVATDPALAQVVARGEVAARAEDDGTVRVVAAGLAPATRYYYAFTAPDGARSALGRTRTTPEGPAARARLAVASCSSLFSGYFNAYRRLAERDDVDLVVHLGDYIYDSIDPQERVRVPPSGAIEDPVDLGGYRRRHALYLADPDLRAARAAHPWFMIWDNHDVARSRPDYGGGVQAFREWNPIPRVDGAPLDRLYRALRFGDLVDLFMVDMYLFRGREALPGDAGASVLGAEQYAWFTDALRGSRARWRVIAMQEVLVEFGALSGWQDFAAARSQLIGFFRAQRVVDNLFLSGDSHFTVYADVVDDPLNASRPYDPDAGVGAIGGEFLPTSISRGNFDEPLGASAATVLPGVRAGFLRRNPHLVDVELASHGYGIVDLTPERVVAETWFSPILAPADGETFYGAYAMPRGANRFARARIDAPTR